MHYPEEFKQKVLSLLGDSQELRSILDRGLNGMPNDIENQLLGRYLNEAAIAEQNEKKEIINELYHEWNEMRNTYYGYHLDANNEKYDSMGRHR